MTNLEQSIQFYESQLTEEQLEEARRESILSFSVDESSEQGVPYVTYLIEQYRKTLEIKYYEGVKRSKK